jgi:hypothetical protein
MMTIKQSGNKELLPHTLVAYENKHEKLLHCVYNTSNSRIWSVKTAQDFYTNQLNAA